MGAKEDFPGLRFDPTPGIPRAIDQLAGQVKAAVDNFSTGAQVLDRAGGMTGPWTGEAADGMHKKMDELRPLFARTLIALTSAHNVLAAWSQHLVVLQQRRARLEAEAVAARQNIEQAEAAPGADFSLSLSEFATMSEADQSAVVQQAEAAKQAIRQAEDRLDEIISRAKALEAEHASEAKMVAEVIRNASKLAPEKKDDDPWYKDAYDGVVDTITHPGDTFTTLGDFTSKLSTVFGTAGFIMTLMPPPVDMYGVVVSAASAYASASAFVFHGLGWAFGGDSDGWDLAKDAVGALPVIGPWGYAWYYFQSPPPAVDAAGATGGPAIDGIRWVWQQIVGKDGKAEMVRMPVLPPEEQVFYNALIAEQLRVQQEAGK
ncbi:hypothetical protein LO772_11990 [Yinghuangia sp. ASG 101]|uniref:hypothetical protein n=1 Tax=Yinghuangia sp. ASG 101 TaxID=2896848 RepID=UPI001E621C97|nr:hypothetical protein [Yinghuangia sp. ASG 101]UGQ14243.1 hypothetical protein LO772_11990 [Yinghuangia sp. ASG 101]